MSPEQRSDIDRRYRLRVLDKETKAVYETLLELEKRQQDAEIRRAFKGGW